MRTLEWSVIIGRMRTQSAGNSRGTKLSKAAALAHSCAPLRAVASRLCWHTVPSRDMGNPTALLVSCKGDVSSQDGCLYETPWVVIGIGRERRSGRRTGQKGTILEFSVGHGSAGSIVLEDEDESSSAGVCPLSRVYMQAPHLHTQDPSRGEAATMMDSATKKDAHAPVEIHYNKSQHEQTLHGKG